MPAVQIAKNEPWADTLRAAIDASDQQDAWWELVAHCRTAAKSKPTKKWIKAADTLREPIGVDTFFDVVQTVLQAAQYPRTGELVPLKDEPAWPYWIDHYSVMPETDGARLLLPSSQYTLTGFVLCCHDNSRPELAETSKSVVFQSRCPSITRSRPRSTLAPPSRMASVAPGAITMEAVSS